jgi:hypothetical protein
MKEWDKTNPTEGYILLRSHFCKTVVTGPWTCSGDPIDLPKSGWFIYRVEPDSSASGLGGSARGRLNDRQPR